MKLYVIRHGQTDYNAERRFQGQANIPLNDVGRDQARRAGLVLGQLLQSSNKNKTSDSGVQTQGIRNETFQFNLISSDLERTRETTSIVCQQLETHISGSTVSIAYDSRLREFHCGLFENHTYEEFVVKNEEIATGYLKSFDQDTYATRYPGPGGESRLDVMERVGYALKDSHEKHFGHDLIWVVHGGVIDVLMELMHIQTQKPNVHRIAAGNGDVLVFSRTEKKETISDVSVRLGHSHVWQLDRHYPIGNAIAARVVR
jgi:probable phosphoglycerate mutase